MNLIKQKTQNYVKTYSDRAERFYLDKLNFSNLGKK